MISSPYMKWEPGKDRSSLLISFAAISGPSGSPSFAFGNVAKDLACSKLYFVDPNEIIYQMGIPGVGSDFWEIADSIRTLQRWEGIKHTTLIGNSAGGFAALVLGAILGNSTVHVFNPPTLLTSPVHTHRRHLCQRVLAASPRNKRTYNLGAFLREETTPTTNAFVYYSRGDAIDRRRTPLLGNIQNLRIIPYNLPGHELARHMAREGTITELLRASVGENRELIQAIVQKSRRRTNLHLPANVGNWVWGKVRRRLQNFSFMKLNGKPAQVLVSSRQLD